MSGVVLNLCTPAFPETETELTHFLARVCETHWSLMYNQTLVDAGWKQQGGKDNLALH